MNQNILIIFVSCLFALLPASILQSVNAQAFFPTFEDAARRVDQQLGDLDSLQLEIGFPEEPRLQVFLWIKGRAWRQEWVRKRSDGSTGIVAAAVGRGDRCTAGYHVQADFPLPVLFFWHQSPGAPFWSGLGIDPDYHAYRFLENTPCLVFGAERHLQDRPQIWLHAEQFVPVRLQPAGGTIWTWTEYRRIGNTPLPHRLQIAQLAGSELHMDLVWRGVNRPIAENLFDPAVFREKFRNAVPPGCELDLCSRLFRILPHGE